MNFETATATITMPAVNITVRPAAVVRRFALAKSILRPAHLAIIDQAAAQVVSSWRTRRPIRVIRLVGNSDRGEAAGLVLGKRRALAVRNALVAAIERRMPGLSRRVRIVLQSLGATRPVADSSTLDGRQQNRRVLIFLSVGSAAPAPSAPLPHPHPTRPHPKPTRNRFPADVVQAAIASRRRWQVPASVTLAQWALESGYGAHMPAGSNNPFGIKAVTGQPFVEATTVEVLHGQRVTVRAKFRKFNSIAEAFDLHGQLLATKRPYRHAMTLRNNPDAFADALSGIYATDPTYGAVLKSMMKKYNLYQHDQP